MALVSLVANNVWFDKNLVIDLGLNVDHLRWTVAPKIRLC